MVNESDITSAFDAEPVWRIVPAADQDGYDGGFVRWDADGETWGETVNKARRGLLAAKSGLGLER